MGEGDGIAGRGSAGGGLGESEGERCGVEVTQKDEAFVGGTSGGSGGREHERVTGWCRAQPTRVAAAWRVARGEEATRGFFCSLGGRGPC